MNIYRGSDAYHFDPESVRIIFMEFKMLMDVIDENDITTARIISDQPQLLGGRVIQDPTGGYPIEPLPSGNPVQKTDYRHHFLRNLPAGSGHIVHIVALDTRGNVYLSALHKVDYVWQTLYLNEFVMNDVVKMEGWYFMTSDRRLFFLKDTIETSILVKVPVESLGIRVKDFTFDEDELHIYVLLDNGDLYMVHNDKKYSRSSHLTGRGDEFVEYRGAFEGYIFTRAIFHNILKVRVSTGHLVMMQQDQTIVMSRGNRVFLDDDQKIVDIETKSDEIITLNDEGYVGMIIDTYIRWIIGWGGGFTFQDQGRQSTKSARR